MRLWLTFILLASATALAQVLLVKTPRNQSYHATKVFLIPADPPAAAGARRAGRHRSAHPGLAEEPNGLVHRVVQHLQLHHRDAGGVGERAARPAGGRAGRERDLRFALAGCAASLVLVGLNHALLAPMLLLARGTRSGSRASSRSTGSRRSSCSRRSASCSPRSGTSNPWLIPFAVAPVLLIHRSLSVPQLEAEARVDPKTGLFNARHFGLALAEEIVRAQRFDRPFALIMADLDLLRDINNSYGHLAGDAVLKGHRRGLPDAPAPLRRPGALRRRGVQHPPAGDGAPRRRSRSRSASRRRSPARAFDVETSSQPIRATVSIGVAAYPRDGQDANELIHQADLAVYRAKLQGRNRVLDASSEPLAVPVDRKPRLVAVPEAADHLQPLPPAVEVIPPGGAASSAAARRPRPELPLALTSAGGLVGLVAFVGIGAGAFGLALRLQPGLLRPARARRARRLRRGAGDRGRRRLDLGQRRGRPGRRGPLRASGCAPARGDDGIVDWSARRYPSSTASSSTSARSVSPRSRPPVFTAGFEGRSASS